MSTRDRTWVAAGAVMTLALSAAAVLQPVAALALLILTGAIVLAVMLPAPNVAAVATLGSILSLSLFPSSAFAGLPLGSFYPVIAAILFIAWGLFRSPRESGGARNVALLAGYYAVLLVASGFSGNADVFYLAILAVAIGVFIVISRATAKQRSIIEAGLITLGLGQAALAFFEVAVLRVPLIGAQQFIQPDNPFLSGYVRAQGTLGHPLVMSFVLLIALALCLRQAETTRNRFLLMPVLLAGIVTSGSSSALIVAFVIVMLTVFKIAGPVGKTLAILFAASVALIVVSSGALATYGAELSGRNLDHRLNSLRAVPKLIAERDILSSVFGSGVASNQLLFSEGIFYNDGFTAIDNQFVTVLAHAGLVGFILFVAFILRSLIVANPTYRITLIGLIAMCASFDFLSWYAPAVAFLAVLALAIPMPRAISPELQRAGLRVERSGSLTR